MLIKKRYLMVFSLAVVSVLLGSLLYNYTTLAQPPLEPVQVDIVNLPVDDEGNLKVRLVDIEVWQVISELQNTVDRLNASLVELEDRVSELETASQLTPRIMTTVGYPEWTQLESGVWIDLVSVSNVVVSEGAGAFAVASVNLRCTEVAYAPMSLRLRINDTYGEELFQGFANVFPPGNSERELVELQHAWTNLPAGTYTFAVQCYVAPWRVIDVRQSRLTILIT